MIKAVAVLLVLGSVCAEMPGIWLDEPVVNPRIVEGEDAKEEEFPYMVSLKRKATWKHACGGSVLSKNWVLTAGHCCIGVNSTNRIIGAGSIYLNGFWSYHDVDKVVIHENYDPEATWTNDICLVRVKKPFEFSKKIQQITLPTQGWPVNSKDIMTVTGWGFTEPGKQDTTSTKLQKAEAFVGLTNEECRRETKMSMHPGHLCARGGFMGQGLCNGDSGSPLVKNGVQVGIASWVFLPCGHGKPDIFCRVPYYSDWIKRQLGDEAKELKFVK